MRSNSLSVITLDSDMIKPTNRILVTGAGGYIGSVVARRLSDMGYDVFAIDNFERGHRMFVDGRVKLHEGDIRDKETVMRVFSEVQPHAVFHFAAYALVGESMSNPALYFENNVSGGINILSAMGSVGCARIIFSSSCATYGVPQNLPIEECMVQNPTNPYGHSKLMFEEICGWMSSLKGLRPTFLRYFNAAGAVPEWGIGEVHNPETHIIPNVLKIAAEQNGAVAIFGGDYPTPDGTCIRDYVHLKDLCEAHVLALEKNCLGAYNLGTGNGISVMQIVEACRKITGRPIPVKICPRRPGDPPALYASGEKARREMGWIPRFSDVETIVRDAWSFMCQKLADGVV